MVVSKVCVTAGIAAVAHSCTHEALTSLTHVTVVADDVTMAVVDSTLVSDDKDNINRQYDKHVHGYLVIEADK